MDKMPELSASHFYGALIFFCGAPCRGAPQNYSVWGPAELFLWRTRLGAPQKVDISVAHGTRAPQKKIVATILWRTGKSSVCATESQKGPPLIVVSVVVIFLPQKDHKIYK